MPMIAIDDSRTEAVARKLSAVSGLPSPTFDDDGIFPPVGSPLALDIFFAVTLHQYGFWTDDGRGYIAPVYAPAGGRSLKGADFVWASALLASRRDAAVFSPDHQASMSHAGLASLFSDDQGKCPLPVFESHLRLARGYGGDMLSLGLPPAEVVERSNASDHPLGEFLSMVTQLTGYREDPLRKKAMLLAVILASRPERFLGVTDVEHWSPIVDYHMQRSALRTGMVRVVSAELDSKLRERRFVTKEEESAVREAVYGCLLGVMRGSGKSLAEVDAFFFGSRKTCPEMEEPRCEECVLEEVCAKEKGLFQPVFSTTFY